jgi:hypothetical protein
MSSSNIEFAFALFANDGDRKSETTFKPFESEPVVADYRIVGLGDEPVAETVEGSAIRDKSRAGNDIVRVNFKVRIGAKTVWLSGALNQAKSKTSDKSPDFFGTLVSKKDGIELDMAGWLKQDRHEKNYLACNAQPPRERATADGTPDAPAEECSLLPF